MKELREFFPSYFVLILACLFLPVYSCLSILACLFLPVYSCLSILASLFIFAWNFHSCLSIHVCPFLYLGSCLFIIQTCSIQTCSSLVFFFKNTIFVSSHNVPREPRRDPSNHRLKEYGIYISSNHRLNEPTLPGTLRPCQGPCDPARDPATLPGTLPPGTLRPCHQGPCDPARDPATLPGTIDPARDPATLPGTLRPCQRPCDPARDPATDPATLPGTLPGSLPFQGLFLSGPFLSVPSFPFPFGSLPTSLPTMESNSQPVYPKLFNLYFCSRLLSVHRPLYLPCVLPLLSLVPLLFVYILLLSICPYYLYAQSICPIAHAFCLYVLAICLYALAACLYALAVCLYALAVCLYALELWSKRQSGKHIIKQKKTQSWNIQILFQLSRTVLQMFSLSLSLSVTISHSVQEWALLYPNVMDDLEWLTCNDYI